MSRLIMLNREQFKHAQNTHDLQVCNLLSFALKFCEGAESHLRLSNLEWTDPVFSYKSKQPIPHAQIVHTLGRVGLQNL